MSAPHIKIPSLNMLAENNFNIAVLESMQRQTIKQVLEMHSLAGLEIPHGQNLVDACESTLPKDAHLYQLYMECNASFMRQPIEELESTSNSLSLLASHLEGDAARTMSHSMTLSQHAICEHSIGEKLAQIIQGARLIEDAGVISTHTSDRLNKLTERPTGPLAAFYDKACALLENRETTPRMKMAA